VSSPQGCEYKDTYNPEVDPSIINAVGTSAFRFGHALIHRNISLSGPAMNPTTPPEPLDENLFNPDMYFRYEGAGHEYALRWTASTKCPMMDR